MLRVGARALVRLRVGVNLSVFVGIRGKAANLKPQGQGETDLEPLP